MKISKLIQMFAHFWQDYQQIELQRLSFIIVVIVNTIKISYYIRNVMSHST